MLIPMPKKEEDDVARIAWETALAFTIVLMLVLAVSGGC